MNNLIQDVATTTSRSIISIMPMGYDIVYCSDAELPDPNDTWLNFNDTSLNFNDSINVNDYNEVIESTTIASAIYVGNISPGDQQDQKIQKLRSELDMSIATVDSIKSLLRLISDPKVSCNYIAIDLEDFYSLDNTDVFDVINTINTVIKCTRPADHQIRLVALVSENSKPQLIREMIKIPSVVLGLKCGGTFTYEMVRDNVIEYNRGNFINSKKVLDLIKPKKNLESKKDLSLTHRQEQILKLICERGLSNKLIASTLKISESTVKLHIGAILKKYGVKNRTQLAVFSRTSTQN